MSHQNEEKETKEVNGQKCALDFHSQMEVNLRRADGEREPTERPTNQKYMEMVAFIFGKRITMTPKLDVR